MEPPPVGLPSRVDIVEPIAVKPIIRWVDLKPAPKPAERFQIEEIRPHRFKRCRPLEAEGRSG
jgi:hypothetical protein